MKKKILLLLGMVVISLIWVGANAQSDVVTNGNFEGGFTADGTGDQIPNGWTKLETFSGGPGETSTIGSANDNGPTLPGSWSLGWGRYNGGTNGDWTACEQTLNYDVSACASLNLTIDVKALYHNLGGSGWTPYEYEYPVTVVIYYIDTGGTVRFWQWGWYIWIDQSTGPRPDHTSVPGNGVVTGQQVQQGAWVANNFNLLTELINPKIITKIRVGGSGWDFEGEADNVQILCTKGWYWKPPYTDYAPNGMPDFDQKQDNWIKPVPGNWSFCGPTAVANCFWWFDSKFNVPAGVPGDANDRFPLVRDYLDNLNAFVGKDDHDPWNVDHAGTPWFPGGVPPATSQPFVPGPQTPGGGLSPWGELVERLAWYMDTDGRRTGYLMTGTYVDSMQAGIDRWLLSEQFQNGRTLADTLYERTIQKPTYAQVESLVEMCEDVILLLGFWYYGPGEQEFIRGDVDESGIVNMADYYRCIDPPPYSCDDARDVDDDGFLTTADCDYLLNFLMGGPPPPQPFPACGLDPTLDALGCAHFPPCPNPSQWWRVGGHYVTVAGVCSDSLKIAFSDPFVDWAEQGNPGRIGSGTIISHPYPHTDSTIHNDAGNVSHDIYDVTLTSPSPGGLWGISNYPASDTAWMRNFNGQSIPGEFSSQTRPWDGENTVFAEVEYAVVISPIVRNRPPQIIQPDTLHGYEVGDTVIYTFDGIDPDGDSIQDQASLSIVPACGTPSVQRISGQGTSTGTWQVTWLTAGCQGAITYKIIVDLKDAFNNTSYCTTYVPLAKRECDSNDPNGCDTLWVECGNMRVPPGGGLVKVDMTIANDESLMVIVVPLSYEGSPISCDSMPPSENTVAKVFANSVIPSGWSLAVSIDHQAKVVVVAGIGMNPPNDCLVPGKGHLGTLTFLGDSCCTIQMDTTAWTGPAQNHISLIRCNDPSQTQFYPVCRIDTCHIDRNHPPVIEQPSSLEAYVGDVVSYTIDGTDPDGDVIQDQASLSIVPDCGSHSITRTSGHGTSSGTWQVSWNTSGCAVGDYLVIHDLTDELGATAYCTTFVQLSEMEGWYWKPPYEDYAPSGMPDFDQKQDSWTKQETDQWSFCGPVAVANCLWWFDSKYNVPAGVPGDMVDMFPLVRQYIDGIGGMISPYDDHDPWNVDHPGTPWQFGATAAPPPTLPQPFMPGFQPPGPMPPWGELVERLAWYFNTDGVQTGYCQHTGTDIREMRQGIKNWLASEIFLYDTLCVKIDSMPTFTCVESLVEKSEDVILLLGFWYYAQAAEQQFIRGDVDENGVVDINDVTRCYGGPPFSCDDAADVDDDGVWTPLDCDFLNNFLMGIGPPPPSPFPDCGIDPTPDGLGCAEFPPCPGGGPGEWYRCGGHYVTVAGVNSQQAQIAFSDPYIDAAEMGFPGRVGSGTIIGHASGHDATVHNDAGNVSHDIYTVLQPSPSPGGRWSLADYPASCYDFNYQNFPKEFESRYRAWDGVSPIFTEVEYALHISPWDYRGDVNHDGIVNVGDVVYLVSYLYRGGPPPVPVTSEGDVNCDGIVNVGDIVYLVSYLYRGGPVPRCCDF